MCQRCRAPDSYRVPMHNDKQFKAGKVAQSSCQFCTAMDGQHLHTPAPFLRLQHRYTSLEVLDICVRNLSVLLRRLSAQSLLVKKLAILQGQHASFVQVSLLQQPDITDQHATAELPSEGILRSYAASQQLQAHRQQSLSHQSVLPFLRTVSLEQALLTYVPYIPVGARGQNSGRAATAA